MATLVRRGDGGEIVRGRRPERMLERFMLEPMRRMRDLFRWDPFVEMAPMLRGERELEMFSPDFDVKETPDAVVLQADLPGVDEKDVEISVDLNRLIVRGKRESEREEKGETYYACERSYGSFVRSFTMPSGVDTDNVHAEMKNGVLTIKVPKPAESRPKKVELKRGQAPAKA